MSTLYINFIAIAFARFYRACIQDDYIKKITEEYYIIVYIYFK